MKRSRRWVSTLLTLCAVIFLLPVLAHAEGKTFNDGETIEATTIESDTTWTIPSGVTVSGQITVSNGCTLTVTGGGTIQRADGYTGSLFAVSGTLDATNVVLDGGNITATAAAITINSTGNQAVNLTGVTIQNFVRSNNCGAVLNMGNGGQAELTDCTIQNNSAERHGGAIYADKNATLNIMNSTMAGNKTTSTSSEYGGGALYVRDATVSLNNVDFSGNSSPRGGAIYNSSYGTLTISGGKISGNTASNTTYKNSAGIFHSSEERRGSVLNLDGTVQIEDPIYLDSENSDKVVILQSALQYPLTLYCGNATKDRVIMQGSDSHTVTAQDMSRIALVNENWYLKLVDGQVMLTEGAAADAYLPVTLLSNEAGHAVEVTNDVDTFTLTYDSSKGGYTGSLTPGIYSVQVDSEFEQTIEVKAGGSNTFPLATRYTVTFDLNDHGSSAPDRQTVKEGDRVTEPTAPTDNDYTFDGWYQDADCTGDPWDFVTDTVSDDMTLYAKWTAIAATAPTISLQPQGTTVTYGTAVNLSVTAGAGNGHTLSYQWYCNTTNSSQGGTPIGGAAGSSYTVPVDTDAGTYYYYCVVTATRTGNDQTADTTTGVAAVTVNRASLTPSATANSKDYDGTTAATGTITLTGAVNGESPTATGTFTFSDANVGDNKAVSVENIVLTNDWNKNYVLFQDTLNTTANITAKTVTLIWSGHENLTYTGNPVNVTATVRESDLVDGDSCTVTVEGGKETNAGDYTATATALSNGNYQLPTGGATQAYTIAQFPVELTWGYTAPFAYDGQAHAVTAVVTNGVGDDTFALTYTNNSKTEAGTYTAAVTGLGNPNYTLTGATGTTLEWKILQATGAASVTMESWTYGDAAKVPVPASDTNDTDNVSYRYTGTTAAGTDYDSETIPTDAGDYTVTATFAATANHEAVSAAADFTIAKKPITGTWQGLNQVYDGQMADGVGIILTGLAAGDENKTATITGDTDMTSAGSHTLTATLANYTITPGTATLVIQKKPVVITVTDNAAVEGSVTLPTINAPGLTEDAYDVVYRDKNGNQVAAPREPGTYEVWVEITDPNYRHPDGSSEKQVGSFTITSTPPTLYAVTFAGGEGVSGTVAGLELAGGSLLTLPPCGYTKDGFQFTGWAWGGKTYQPGDQVTTVYGAMAFTAQWQQLYAASGTVTEPDEGDTGTKPVFGAVVSIWLGADKLAETSTGTDGTYRFPGLAPGIYNLVVSRGEQIVTQMVSITGSDVTQSFHLPEGITNSVVEVTPGSPGIVVGKLDEVFDDTSGEDYTPTDAAAVEQGGKVEITFTADEQAANDVADTIVKDLQSVSGSNLALFLECTLEKEVYDSAGQKDETASKAITQSSVLLEVRLPLPTQLQGKYGYTVSRFHDGKAQLLTTTANELDEYFEINADKTVLTLHVKCFSTYAVGYTEQSTSGGTTTYPPVQEASEHGSFTVSPARPTIGQKVTITPKPDEGYEVGAVAVTDRNGKDVQVTRNDDGTYSFTQPSGSVTITVTFRSSTGASDCPRDETCPMSAFHDVNMNAWYHDGVHYCVAEGLMSGYGDGVFGPGNTLSRAMLAQILYNLENRPAVSGESPFEDVSDGAWYADAVNWAASHEIVGGYGNGTYGPGTPITREQLATILYRYAQYKGYDVRVGEDTNILSYTDASKISAYAIAAMQWACGAGIMEGYDGALTPGGTATRAEVATMLMRFAETVAQ